MTSSKNIFCKTLASVAVCLALFAGCGTAQRAGTGTDIVPEPVRLVVENARENNSGAGNAPGPEGGELVKFSPVAVFPVTNISRVMVPDHKIRELSKDMLRENGFGLLDDGVLDVFMERHRMRYVGGIDRASSLEFSKETKAGAVLVTYLEHYDEKYPPKIAITYRLVSTGDNPRILWTDSVGLAGDDSPGILGLGLIKEPPVLIYSAVQRLSDSLQGYMLDPGEWRSARQGMNKIVRTKPATMLEADYMYNAAGENGDMVQEERERFRPKVYTRADGFIERDRQYTVAVLPLFNRSERRYAGDIMEQHFVRELVKLGNINIIEPGVVRAALLKSRVVMYDGISLDHAVVVSSMLNADMIVTGTVLDYEDYKGPIGVPKVDFSAMLIDRRSHTIVWTSKSYNEGDDSVLFFDLGKINTAHAMATEMTRVVSEMMFGY